MKCFQIREKEVKLSLFTAHKKFYIENPEGHTHTHTVTIEFSKTNIQDQYTKTQFYFHTLAMNNQKVKLRK